MEDEALIARVRRGDLAAASELLRRHEKTAYSAALRLVGGRTEAEDIAQEALVRAYTHLGELDDGSTFGPWLRRIAINLSLNALRRRGRLQFESLDAVPHPFYDFEDRLARTPEEHALSASDLTGMDALFEHLPPEQRVAVVLSDVYDYDIVDVAALSRCKLSAAKMRIARGRATLRKLLEEQNRANGDPA
ncbi:MAG: RNA polymerase sigma factor [Candidatus Eremiobacteraeota bacterium]|nr:RNA polymerase sigma factor [Candidatus Eremiobacteraeota bacterium]MBC5803009.1 RNA polymerase sigma factor [Candidatus Eremiobacteraeota bacterium]MBC5820724.1 RNA polymerase sigma factor [Candidatus Eremiobacteraeota bacterium]